MRLCRRFFLFVPPLDPWGLPAPRRGPTAFQGPTSRPLLEASSILSAVPPPFRGPFWAHGASSSPPSRIHRLIQNQSNPEREKESFRATRIGSNQLSGWATPQSRNKTPELPGLVANSCQDGQPPENHLGAVVPLVAWIGYLTALLVSDDPPPSFCVIVWVQAPLKTLCLAEL